jgi:type I restriction enzyme S subunit
LGEIIDEYNEKTTDNNMYPVLSSTKSGIHLQSEYFNKEAASNDTTGYKIIPKGYCTYRSMSDTGKFTFNVQKLIEIGIAKNTACAAVQVVPFKKIYTNRP